MALIDRLALKTHPHTHRVPRLAGALPYFPLHSTTTVRRTLSQSKVRKLRSLNASEERGFTLQIPACLLRSLNFENTQLPLLHLIPPKLRPRNLRTMPIFPLYRGNNRPEQQTATTRGERETHRVTTWTDEEVISSGPRGRLEMGWEYSRWIAKHGLSNRYQGYTFPSVIFYTLRPNGLWEPTCGELS